jgi:hypothetical protein
MITEDVKRTRLQNAASAFVNGTNRVSNEMKLLEIDAGFVIVAFACGCHALMWQDWDESWWLGANPTYCFTHEAT